jgi:2-methyl-3-hydroxypyridine 5-carboxylic acid dioxygenase
MTHDETTRLDSSAISRIAIIGDAAHAMPPTLAQGAGCAMMNALSGRARVRRIGHRGGSATVGGSGASAHGPHPSAIRGACPPRALGNGMQWDDIGLRAAPHVPTGTQPKQYERVRRSQG